MRALVLIALLAGCRPFEVATPPGFVELEERGSGYQYRATTADRVVLAVRAVANRPRGEAAFWRKAIENELRAGKGYALLDSKPVRCRGAEGTLLRFGHDEGRRPHLYQVGVFVTRDRIYLVEAGGPRDLVDRLQPQIDWFLANFTPDPR